MPFDINTSYPLEAYSPETIQKAYLIVHPKVLERYNITRDRFFGVFEEGSNFWRLQNPLRDTFGNTYWDSEGYYMAQRVKDQSLKSEIAEASKIPNRSKRRAYDFEEKLEKDPEKRISYMRNTLREKTRLNPEIEQALKQTQGRVIIELTYWGDRFFGISHQDFIGRNILGKLYMELYNTL